MTATLRLDTVGVRRRGRVILDDISMECQQGTVTSLHGPNGVGKSTLLGVATGLVAPSWGSVQNRSTRASYLPERFTPPSGMDVTTYMRWIAGTRGIHRRGRDRKIAATLDSLGFSGSWGPLRLLSKGNLQRVGIASALIGGPGLIVLDEPFTAIDTAGIGLVARAMEAVSAEGSTLLVVHHGTTPFSVSQSLWLAEGKVRDAPEPMTQYTIHASAGVDLPVIPSASKITWLSPDRAVITATSDALESVLSALLDAGWKVEEVERC